MPPHHRAVILGLVPSIFFPTLHCLQEEADALPEDEKHWGPTSSHVCKVHHVNVAHLTKAMEAYYGSRGQMYTKKTLQISCQAAGVGTG
ncbi:MAG: hypothetical protein M1815_001641 [Lichina confinis]|nr:MAG: hypothetical protein M1815_001641 [Lichina confinis]